MKAKILDRWAINLPEDREVFHRERTHWEQERVESMFLNVNKGDVIVDVGTEVGDYAALFTLWGAKVFCIEPQPKYWPIIKKHFDMNNIKPLGCFAGFSSNVTEANPPRADFDIGYKGIWPNVAFDELEDWHGFRNVIETGVSTPQMRLDELMAERGVKQVDLITIDVEGAEFEVLKGAVTTLNVDKPLVYLSLHPEMLMNDWGNRPDDIFNYMRELGYKWAFLAKDHEEHYVFWNDERGSLMTGSIAE